MKTFEGKGTLTIPLNRTFINYNIGKGEICYNHNDTEKNVHYQLWEKINSYLKRRGFKILADPFIVKQFKSLSKDHRYGIKKNLEFISRRYPTGFELEFFQSLVFENVNGARYDFNKYERMPYMVKLSYRNEAMRLAKYAESIGVNVRIEKQLTDIEEIIKDNNQNPHIHGHINSLDDIKLYMENNDKGTYNTKDKDGKLIICGEFKCFYDYHNKIAIGQAYHNINNMWWLLVNGKRYNIANFYLFDQFPGIPKKKPLTHQEQIQRLHTELKTAEASQNYERCIVLRNLLKPLKLYNIKDLEKNCWWRGNNSGYINDKSHAGVYTEETILKSPEYYNNGKDTKAVAI